MLDSTVFKDIFSFFIFSFYKTNLIERLFFWVKKRKHKQNIKFLKTTTEENGLLQITGIEENSKTDKTKRIERMVGYALTGIDPLAVDIELRKWKKRMMHPDFNFKKEAEMLAKVIMANAQAVEVARRESRKNVIKSVTAGKLSSVPESAAS